jgi:hypothetical protein
MMSVFEQDRVNNMTATANRTFADYYRCPEEFAHCGAECQALADDELGLFSFNPSETIEDLRRERYLPSRRVFPNPIWQSLYYFLRSAIPSRLRWWLQRIAYAGWDRVPFPRWPVDTTVEDILECLWRALLCSERKKIPFIWFWPDGYSGAAMMTHDVETAAGLAFCSSLMNIDDSFGIKSAFELVPEGRYAIPDSDRREFRTRGFEVNVHDFNHDGLLFADRQKFIERVQLINNYAKEFGASGFRSGMMYRDQDWYDALDVSYDMSVPNVAHLEPQQGGCCTVMPYFVGKVLVLPLTTTQDFALFHVIRDYSIDLWKEQIGIILEKHGLTSFIVHPDYLRCERAQRVYKDLLSHLSALRAKKVLWVALPGEIHKWWVQRSQMMLVHNDSQWRIEGPGRERARIAYASLKNGRLVYEVEGIGDYPNMIIRSQLDDVQYNVPSVR